jgi:sarcosine oxidase delta subunit
MDRYLRIHDKSVHNEEHDHDEGCRRSEAVCKGVLGSYFGMPKVSHEEAASAKVVSKRWPKVPFHGASAF